MDIIAFGDIGRTNARDLERYVLIFSHTNTFLLGFPPESWLANDDDGVRSKWWLSLVALEYHILIAMASTQAMPPLPTGQQQPTTPPPSSFETPPLAVLPGDDLTRFILTNPPPVQTPSGRKNKKSRSNQGGEQTSETTESRPPKLGTGLITTQVHSSDSQSSDDPIASIKIKAILAGRLLYRPSTNTWFVASNPKRYHLSNSPSNTSYPLAATGSKKLQNKSSYGIGDRILGIIEDQKASADYYRVNIFSSHSALLHVLSFEGATKRNRPQLEPGCLIYCRIIKSFGGRMDMEVSCKVGGSGSAGVSVFNNDEEEEGDDGGASRKDWLTNEGTYGPLTGGMSFKISLGLARELLNPKNAVLSALDKSKLPFEIAVGVNGMVWINSPCAEYTIVVMNAIQNSEVMSAEQVRGMVKRMVQNVKQQMEDDT